MKKTFLEFAKARTINKIAAISFICAVAACNGSFISNALQNHKSPPIAETTNLSAPTTPSLTAGTPTPITNHGEKEKRKEEEDDNCEKKEVPHDDIDQPNTSNLYVAPSSIALASTSVSSKESEELQPLTLSEISDTLQERLRGQLGNDILLCGFVLSSEEKRQLFSYLLTNPPFTSIVLIGRDINDDDIDQLAYVLTVNTTLKHIDLSHNHIGDAGASLLMNALARNSTLTSLNLSYNNIGNEGASEIISMIRSATRQIDIIIGNNSMGDTNANQISLAMVTNPHYRRVALSWTIQQAVMKKSKSSDKLAKRLTLSFSPAIIFINSLRNRKSSFTNFEADFSQCALTSQDIDTLTVCLKDNLIPFVHRINLNNTGLCYDSIKTFILTVETNTTIQALDLSNNLLKDGTAKLIARTLHKNHTLTELHLQNTGISNDEMATLLSSISRNTSIRFCDLSGNDIDCNKINLDEIKHPMTLILSYNPEFVPQRVCKHISYQMKERNHKKILIVTISDPKK